ncbi:MAG: PqiC family protein [Puniceicoccales bacterium]|jgi:uncharacterized lipoprotein YmbA|nr:PqiC family protein [Puniceicoccales bacterium]
MKSALIFTFSLVILLLPGCSIFVPQKDNSVFYTLSEHSSTANDLAKEVRDDSVVINLIINEIPSYADCPYIATQQEQNKIFFSEIHRWAEPFEDSCCRVIRDRLCEALRGRIAVISSMYAIGNQSVCDYWLSIDLDDAIYNAQEGNVIVKCSWSLFNYATKKRILLRKYSNSTAVKGDAAYENIVEAMRVALMELADDILEKIQAIEASITSKVD